MLKAIRKRFKGVSGEIIAGIGDDAAVLQPGTRRMLLTTDMMSEGIHFDLEFTTYFQVGYKLIASNVSDIFAMGGTPRFALLSLSLPAGTEEENVQSFFGGIQKALKTYGLFLIGGDLSSSLSGMVVSATLLGYVSRPVMRSGARIGDRIYVTGNLGDAACGLEIMRRLRRPVSIETGETSTTPLSWKIMKPLITRHLLPEARNPKTFVKGVTSMIDISDGLFIDLLRLCDESKVGARIFTENIPLSAQMRKAAASLGIDPLALAISGGEDYELLFTSPPSKKIDAVCIGEVTKRKRVFVDLKGRERPILLRGYQHWH